MCGYYIGIHKVSNCLKLNPFSIRGETVQVSRGHEERAKAKAIQYSGAGPEPADEQRPPKHVGYGPLPHQTKKTKVNKTKYRMPIIIAIFLKINNLFIQPLPPPHVHGPGGRPARDEAEDLPQLEGEPGRNPGKLSSSVKTCNILLNYHLNYFPRNIDSIMQGG